MIILRTALLYAYDFTSPYRYETTCRHVIFLDPAIVLADPNYPPHNSSRRRDLLSEIIFVSADSPFTTSSVSTLVSIAISISAMLHVPVPLSHRRVTPASSNDSDPHTGLATSKNGKDYYRTQLPGACLSVH